MQVTAQSPPNGPISPGLWPFQSILPRSDPRFLWQREINWTIYWFQGLWQSQGGLESRADAKKWGHHTSMSEHLALWPLINLKASMRVKSFQSCPTLCDYMDCSLPGSSVRGILQARILEWDADALPQGIFPTQGSNLHLFCLLHWQVSSSPLAPREPRKQTCCCRC